MKNKSKNLIIVLHEDIDATIRKGEVIDRYYNPGDYFDSVVLILIHFKCSERAALQRMMGRAKLIVHEVAKPSVLALIFKPLMEGWFQTVIETASRYEVDVIRVYGRLLNLLAAYRIKQSRHIPYIVSLHTDPLSTDNYQKLNVRFKLWLINDMTNLALRSADLVIPVYRSIIPYLNKIGVERYEVAYNFVSLNDVKPKSQYAITDELKLVTIGQLARVKNPKIIIDSIADIDRVTLDIFGDGMLADSLKQYVIARGLGHKIKFRGSIANELLCAELPKFDICLIQTKAREFSKVMLECLNTGLPTIVNKLNGESIAPEILEHNFFMECDATTQGYRNAILKLWKNESERKLLAANGKDFINKILDHTKAEQKFVDIYQRFLDPHKSQAISK